MKSMSNEWTRERLISFFISTADAIDILDLDGNIIDVNHAFESLYGWKHEEVVGNLLPMIQVSRIEEVKSLIDRAKIGEDIRGYQTVCAKKDGTFVEISLTFSPIRDVHGNIVAISGTARDITEQKKLVKDL